MHVKTMEGLIGARTNMELLNTPFRVFKEARRKGDTAMMERAMGYMGDFHEDAYEYKEKADEGMKKDAEETRKIAEEQREEAIEKRREEREKLEERIAENRNSDTNTDTVEISEEGKVLLKDNTETDSTDSDVTKTDVVKEAVTYTKTGETVSEEQDPSISVSV
ncbi:MAG: hypothetical protein HDR07_09490 [Lachnospiraceae bacterium]|nr:hypothetical protein [Lachnospiraceae bacterium]